MTRELIDDTWVDLDQLDERLDDLKPMIRRWARSDPVERELAIDAASIDELLGLWHTIERLPIITAHIEDPAEPEHAELLDNLLSAAITAAYEIERRTGTDLLAAN